MSAKIRCTALIFEPIAAVDAPNNSIYSDSGNSSAFTNKTSGGSEAPVVEATDSFTKRAFNSSGVEIAQFKAVSKASDGSIVLADSDAAEGQQPIGVTLEAIPNNNYGRVGLVGRNVPGALTGLGFVPGQDVYISQTAGFTNDPNSFTDNDDSIILIGIADCADETLSAIANDLIMCKQVLVRP